MIKLTVLLLVVLLAFNTQNAQPSRTPITPENADQVRLIDVLGRGYHYDIRWEGNHLLVESESGTWQYDANVLTAPPLRVNPRMTNFAPWWFTYSDDYSFRIVKPSDLSSDKSHFIVENTATGEQLALLDLPESSPNFTAFSPDNRIAAVSGCSEKDAGNKCLRGEIILWNIQQNEHIFTISQYPGGVGEIKFSPDGKLLISKGGAGLVIWDIENGGLPLKVIPQADVFLLSDDNRNLFYTAGNDIHIWHVDRRIDGPIWKGHKYPLTTLALSPDGNTLASADEEHGDELFERNSTIRFWDVQTGEELAAVSHGNFVEKLIFHPSGYYLASIGEGNHMGNPNPEKVKVWNASSGQLIVEIDNSMWRPAISAAFSPGGPEEIALLYVDGAIRIFRLAGYEKDYTSGFGGRFELIKFSPDSKRLISSNDSSATRIWDIATGIQLFTLPASQGVAYSPDGSQIAVVRENAIEFFDAHIGIRLSSIPLSPPVLGVMSAEFHPNGNLLAIGTWESGTRLINLLSGQVTPIIEGDTREILFSPDGSFLVSESWDRTVSIFDVNLKNITILPFTGDALTFSPNSQTILINTSEHHALLWNVETNEQEITFDIDTDFYTRYAVFSPDGRLLVTSADILYFWNAATGELISTLHEQAVSIGALAFSPDGTMVVTASGMSIGGADKSYQLEVMGVLGIPSLDQ